jgi:hypothetical protein
MPGITADTVTAFLNDMASGRPRGDNSRDDGHAVKADGPAAAASGKIRLRPKESALVSRLAQRPPCQAVVRHPGSVGLGRLLVAAHVRISSHALQANPDRRGVSRQPDREGGGDWRRPFQVPMVSASSWSVRGAG